MKIFVDERPSAQLACAPAPTVTVASADARYVSAHACVAGQPAVAVRSQALIAPIGSRQVGSSTMKINKYTGTSTTSAMGEGVATSIRNQKVSVLWTQTVGVDKVRDDNVHGIPPRGRPV